MNVQRMTRLSMFTVLALALYSVESLLPPFFPIPGMKLGLANIVTLYLLYQKPGKTKSTKGSAVIDALLVLVMRILLSSLLFGQLISLLYSFAGGLCSFGMMVLISRFLRQHFPPLCGMAGGCMHNLGQLGIAILLTASFAPLLYAPYLILSGLLCGGLLGQCISISLRKKSL
jgi:heptaprenyl diphosphate synthase